MGHLCLLPRLKDSLSSSPGKQVLQVGPSPSAHGDEGAAWFIQCPSSPRSPQNPGRSEVSPLGSKVTCPRKAVTPGLQLRLPQGTRVFEFPIKPPRPDPSPHICGNKKFPVGRGRCSLLPRPPWDPRRLRGRRGRLHQPQRAKPGKLQRAFRPCRGERQTPTRLSLSTSAFKPGGGRHLSARGRPARSPLCSVGPPPPPPQPGLSCSNLARPWPGSDARSPPGRPGAGARGGAGRAEWGAAPAGATRGRTRGARAGAATGSRGEPPTSPAQGRGPPRTAGTWMRRSPSRGGRGAARAGDARREGRLGSGRRMAEVSGGAGQRRGALPDEGHLLAGVGRAAGGRTAVATACARVPVR